MKQRKKKRRNEGKKSKSKKKKRFSHKESNSARLTYQTAYLNDELKLTKQTQKEIQNTKKGKNIKKFSIISRILPIECFSRFQ